MEAISDRHRTYAFDLWGFGDSDHSPQRYDLGAYEQQLGQFIDNMGLGETPVTLVGHALGAAIAVRYANQARLPEQRVLRIMAVSLPLGPNAIDRRLTPGGGSLLDRVLGRRAAVDYPEVDLEAQKADPNAIMMSARLVAGADQETARAVEKLDMPLLLVHGEKDPLIAPPSPDLLHVSDQNVKPITLSDSRHFPMLDEASKFQRLLKDFLETKPEDLQTLALKEEWRRRTH